MSTKTYKFTQKHFYHLLAWLNTTALLYPAAAMAQSTSGPSAPGYGFEEILVTAQKRTQSVQNVAITMSVLSGNDMEKMQINNVVDIARISPNIQINTGLGATAFIVRGVGLDEFVMNFESPIAVHLDEVYYSKNFMTGLLLFDIERVEVLKGPQGTLFGRNATGGSVNFYSRAPSEVFGAGGTVSYDDYETVRGEAYITGPISEGLSFRLSGMGVHQNQGYFKNTLTGGTEGMERKYAGRAQLLWKGSDTNVTLTANYGRDNSTNPPFEVSGIYTPESLAAGTPVLCPEYLAGTVTGATANCVRTLDASYPGDDDPYTTDIDLPHKMHNKGYGATVKIEHNLGWADLTSITSYQNYLRDEQQDTEGGPLNLLNVYNYNKIKQFTHESRIASQGDQTWHYVLGVFFEHDKLSETGTLELPGGENTLHTAYDQKLDTIALFFHNNVELNETFSLVAGLRYSKEWINIDGGSYFGTDVIGHRKQIPRDILATLATSDLVVDGGKRRDDNASFKVGIEWRPKDDFLAYAHASTGYRSGGFNAYLIDRQDAFTSLAPESLTAYEIGFKSALMNNQVIINGAVFHYDLEDGLVNVDRPGSITAITVNAANIKTIGAELEMRWRPAGQGLELMAAGGWLDSEVKSNLTVGGQSLQGNTPVNSPTWTFSGQAIYETPITGSLNLRFAVDGNWRSKRYMEVTNLPANLQQSYWLVNGQISIEDSDDLWWFGVWVKNLSKTKERTFVNDVLGHGLISIYGPPRRFGATLGVRF